MIVGSNLDITPDTSGLRNRMNSIEMIRKAMLDTKKGLSFGGCIFVIIKDINEKTKIE
ncbi:hypothetical protein DSCOOX_51490 [Desulfosarcina ovata subsp. ovata]|uniref:Uncharacterized protein n=1 Tax=Desulfosarcina ovata subsp. ovata TaxID=2752305 RepID=A0A5K8AHK9_9BACT|nr:hypothetical protein DSCOOX_51490 [Desulfosarcina ovata subsp. ovata]